MGLTDIEWDDGYVDPLDLLSPSLRRKTLEREDQESKKWSKRKRTWWLIGLIASFIWAAPWCVAALLLTVFTLGLGFPLAILAWTIGTGPASALIVSRLRLANGTTIPTD